MPKRKCEISGTDEEGDVWTFATGDRERAEGVLDEMREDLENVEMKENRDRAQRPSGLRQPRPHPRG